MRQKIDTLRAHLCALVLFLFLSGSLMAQKQVTGVVTSAKDKSAIAYVTVTVKGTNIATVTSATGAFSITMPAGRNIIVFSNVGYDDVEVDVSSQTSVSVSLKEKTASLDEVVVTGYTAQRKKDITGAVTVVKVSDLQSVPAADAQSQLQGRAAGVNVIQDYTPGSAGTVRIRGFASFTGNDPLYIVDGVPTGSLSGINPTDIESMQILKDAASASVYGARASNGVIVVTTKKGKSGSAKVSYDMYSGTQDPGKGFTNLLGSQGRADLQWLALKNSGRALESDQYGNGASPVLPDYIFAGGQSGVQEGDPLADPAKYDLSYSLLGTEGYNPYLIVPANKEGTNWFDEITRKAPINNQNITVSGANDKNKYLFSFNYFNQQSILQYNFYKRYTGRINTEFNIKNNIRIGENLQIFTSERNTTGNNSEGTVIANSYREQSIIPVYTIKQGDFAGSRGSGLGNGKNPLATLYRSKDNRNIDFSLLGNMYVEVDVLKHFTARTSFGGTLYNYNYYNYPFIEYENAENNANTTYAEGFGRGRSWTWTNQLTYKNVFADKHSVNILLGTEAVSENGRQIDASKQTYFVYNNLNYITLSSGTSNPIANGAPYTPSSLFSLYGKLDYIYNNKYILSFTARRDGSSRFGPDNRYGFFPAASIGWRVTSEPFAANIGWLNDLKIRASYGRMGNQRINSANQFTLFGSGASASGYGLNGSSLSIGNFLSFIGNAAGKWETNETANVGFDAVLFRGNTSVVFDVYQKKTKDLLYTVEQSALAGATASQNPPSFNVGSMKNWGIDLQVSQKANFGGQKGLNMDASLTFTTYKNEVTAIADGIAFFDADAGESGRIGGVFTRNSVGIPINSFYGYDVIGLFSDANDVTKSPTQKDAAPGRFKYRDADNNGVIDANDRVFFGDPNPSFSYGLNLNLNYRGVDMAAFFYGVAGKESINYTKWWTDFYPSFQGGKSVESLNNSWTTTNTSATIPIQEVDGNTSTNGVPNSYYLENSSYFRLKSLQIGYTISNDLTKRIKIDRFRVYLQATNIFTITKYSGLDPEITNFGNDLTSGIDAGVYPAVKQFLIGASIVF